LELKLELLILAGIGCLKIEFPGGKLGELELVVYGSFRVVKVRVGFLMIIDQKLLTTALVLIFLLIFPHKVAQCHFFYTDLRDHKCNRPNVVGKDEDYCC
jgi:hypothetical protein